MSHPWTEVKHVGFGSGVAVAGVAVAGEAVAGTSMFLDAASKGSIAWSEMTGLSSGFVELVPSG